MAAPETHISKPIPVHVVTGPLGVGKTTVIAHLLSTKPVDENWVVLLNEFSLAGIDALTVASAARGAYDVRMVPGGCLCCAGEDDFRRNLRQLIDDVRPARILVEPSGIGHPAGIVEELLGYQASGRLSLESVVALIDPARVAAAVDGSDELLRDHLDIADAIALTKADEADVHQLGAFATLVERAASAPAWSGAIERGALPFAALQAGVERARGVPPTHGHDAHPAHETARSASPPAVVKVADGERELATHLGFPGARWTFPRRCGFDEQRVLGELTRVAVAARPARLKAVLRVAEDRWLLIQHHGGSLSMRDISWRRDSRIELVFPPGSAPDWSAWDALWERSMPRAA